MQAHSPQRAPRSPRNVERTGAQRSQLLDALVSAYPSALTLSRLREVAGARPGARVAELRRQGWQIATVCVEEESRLSTYRLLDLRPQAELEIHAACTVYHDSAQGWHARVHAELSETYSPEELQDAAEEALAAFRSALSRGDLVSASTPRVTTPQVQVSRAQPSPRPQPDFSVPLDQLSSDWRTW